MSQRDIQLFAAASGDRNPLHLDPDCVQWATRGDLAGLVACYGEDFTLRYLGRHALSGLHEGKARSLAEFKGKTVVLEWTNNGCPYVQKHYNSGNMQSLQEQATKDGVAWLTIVSSIVATVLVWIAGYALMGSY